MGGKEFSFGDITVLNDEKAGPSLRMRVSWPDPLSAGGFLAIHISISHEQDHCVASVIIETRP
jgi:phosphopantetheinyl transferase (holo-ACP synthase)